MGKHIILKNYEQAFETILRADSEDVEKRRVISEFLETKDAPKALKELHYKHTIERTLIDGFRKAGRSNFLGAIMNITKTMRNLYVHAYQSLLWNKVLSQRMKNFGKELIVGDYVQDKDGLTLITSSEQLKDKSIYDLTIPIWGTETVLDESSIVGRYYLNLLKEEGLSQQNLENHPNSFGISGGWRKAITLPENFIWKLIGFEDWKKDLLSLEFREEDLYFLPQIEGKQKALIIQFCLPRANYATMLIRELLHRETDMGVEQKMIDKLKDSESRKQTY